MSTTARTPLEPGAPAPGGRPAARPPAPRTAAATPGRGLRATLARRWPAAVGAAATVASLAVVSPLPQTAQTAISAWGVLTAAVIYLTWGTARGDLGDRRWLTAQTAAVLGLGGLAVAAVAVAPDAARFVLAAGWLTHAAWDAFHHHADRVVPRWYAELCMAADLVVAGSLLLLGAH